jgi:hypothetical protein
MRRLAAASSPRSPVEVPGVTHNRPGPAPSTGTPWHRPSPTRRRPPAPACRPAPDPAPVDETPDRTTVATRPPRHRTQPVSQDGVNTWGPDRVVHSTGPRHRPAVATTRTFARHDKRSSGPDERDMRATTTSDRPSESRPRRGCTGGRTPARPDTSTTCAAIRPGRPGRQRIQPTPSSCLAESRPIELLLQVLARGVAVRSGHPYGHHVGEVDDHGVLGRLAVVSRSDQDQAAPLVQSTSDRLDRRLLRESPHLSRRRPHRRRGGTA